MKPMVLLVLSLLLLCPTTSRAAQDKTEHKLTVDQAKELVMAALTPKQRRLPKLGAEPYDAPDSSSKFLFFTVTWAGTPNGSVVVGNYAVDPNIGDVFSATIGCYEAKNTALQKIQARVRASLLLSAAEYRRLKTKGPLCE